MHSTEPIIYNFRVPRELKMFLEMIEYVSGQFEGVKWSNKKMDEIGFIYKNKSKGTEYFFGIWFDLWEQYGKPLSLSLSYTGKAPNEWHEKIKKFVVDNYSSGIQIKNFENWTCVLFEHSFFQFDKGDDNEKLSEFYYKVTEYADSIAHI